MNIHLSLRNVDDDTGYSDHDNETGWSAGDAFLVGGCACCTKRIGVAQATDAQLTEWRAELAAMTHYVSVVQARRAQSGHREN